MNSTSLWRLDDGTVGGHLKATIVRVACAAIDGRVVVAPGCSHVLRDHDAETFVLFERGRCCRTLRAIADASLGLQNSSAAGVDPDTAAHAARHPEQHRQRLPACDV